MKINEKGWVVICLGVGPINGTNGMTKDGAIEKFRKGDSKILTPAQKEGGYRAVKCTISYDVSKTEWDKHKI